MIVSVIIPTHNGARYLERCLPSVERSELPPGAQLEVIVVDNGSSDGTPDLLRRYRSVKPLVFASALGFAGANNAARQVARGDVVCFLNNDTEVDRRWLVRPLEILARDPAVAAVGSKLLFMHRYIPVTVRVPDGGRIFVDSRVFGSGLDSKVRWSIDAGPEDVLSGARGRWLSAGSRIYIPLVIEGIDPQPSRPSAVRFVARSQPASGVPRVTLELGRTSRSLSLLPGILPLEVLGTLPSIRLVQNAGVFVNERAQGGDVGTGEEDGTGRFSSEEVVPAICGAALIARRRALDEAGWFPTYYTMYYEDVDLCLRLRRGGRLLVFCPSSVVSHYHTGTNHEFSPRFLEHVARSSLLFACRYGDRALIRQTLAQRARDVRAELRSLAPRPWRERWAAAHGSRGSVKGLLALAPVTARRILGASSGKSGTSEHHLLRLARTPYNG